MKRKYFLAVSAILIFGISGCGVSKEDYEEKVGELDSANQQVVKLENQLKEKDVKITELEKSKGEEAKKLAALQKELDTAQKKAEEMAATKTKELDEYVGAMDKLRSQNTSIQQQLTEKSESLAIVQGVLIDKEKSIKEIQELLSQKTGALTDLQSQLDKLQLSSLGSTSELNDLKALVSSKDAALKGKDAQITAKDSELQKKNSQIEALMKQLDALKKGNVPGLGGAGGFLNR